MSSTRAAPDTADGPVWRALITEYETNRASPPGAHHWRPEPVPFDPYGDVVIPRPAEVTGCR